MSITMRQLTYDDLLQIPDGGKRYEIIDGALQVSPSAIPRHEELLQRLTLMIGNDVSGHRIGKLYTAPPDVRWRPPCPAERPVSRVLAGLTVDVNALLADLS